MSTARPVDAESSPAADDVEEGTCALCGQCLLRTADDCWHPWNVERECPPEPPVSDRVAWVAWYRSGARAGRPGREHFVPGGG